MVLGKSLPWLAPYWEHPVCQTWVHIAAAVSPQCFFRGLSDFLCIVHLHQCFYLEDCGFLYRHVYPLVRILSLVFPHPVLVDQLLCPFPAFLYCPFHLFDPGTHAGNVRHRRGRLFVLASLGGCLGLGWLLAGGPAVVHAVAKVRQVVLAVYPLASIKDRLFMHSKAAGILLGLLARMEEVHPFVPQLSGSNSVTIDPLDGGVPTFRRRLLAKPGTSPPKTWQHSGVRRIYELVIVAPRRRIFVPRGVLILH